MPENATLCLISEGVDFSTYLLDGEVHANGRLTSDGVSTLMKQLDGETFEGTGIFEGVGTLNGTGLFIGGERSVVILSTQVPSTRLVWFLVFTTWLH